MKYFPLHTDIKGREVLGHMEKICTQNEMVEFINEYQVFLSRQDGKPEYDRRVIERTIYYMLGFMTGTGIKHEDNRMNKWKEAINQELYSKYDSQHEGEHRLIEL